MEFDEPQWLFQIVAGARLKKFRPEILFVTDYSTFSASFIRQVKSEVPSIKLVLGWCGAPYRDGSVFNEYDLILCCIRNWSSTSARRAYLLPSQPFFFADLCWKE